VREKGLREANVPASLLSGILPVDPDGNPMAIVVGQASDLVPTVAFGNVNVGPVAVMRPCENTDEAVHHMARWCQQKAEEIVGSERRLVQWAIDPASKVMSPEEIAAQQKSG
jgi:hypothetical protein